MSTVVSAAPPVLERERREFESRTPRSRERFRRACDVLPGGDTRSATFYAPYPVGVERAEGIQFVDLDGNEYVDFLPNYASLITGHRHPDVMAAAVAAMSRVTAVAAPVPGDETALANEGRPSPAQGKGTGGPAGLAA